jgi:crotonobetainyl-CoA:carnitine CoA-transferase CaiB-like acyl-CoA transferase
VNPRLVYAKGGGLGAKGELAEIAAQDTTGAAFSGLMYTLSKDGTPFYPAGAFADVIAGTNLAFAIVTALLRREATGKGEVVSTSLLQGMMWLQQLHVGAMTNNNEVLRSFEPADATNAFLNLYRCGDDEWIALGMTAMNTEDWYAACEAIGRPDLKDDDRFERNRGRIEHARELVAVLTEALARQPRAHWLERFTAINLPCAPVQRLNEVLADPRVEAEEMLTRTTSGMTYVGVPFNLEGVPAAANDAPDYAADTLGVLTDRGLTPEEIAELQRDGTVW